MANKPFEIQSSTLTIGGVDLQAGNTSIVIPGVTQATSYKVEEVEDTGDQTQQFTQTVAVIDYVTYQEIVNQTGNGSTRADYLTELDDDGYIDDLEVGGQGSYTSQESTNNANNDMYAYIGTSSASDRPIVPQDWVQIPFRPKMRAGEIESIGGGSGNQLVETDDGNTFALMNTGDVVFDGEGPGGVDRGIVWQYGDNNNGVNSMVRQDEDGLTVRAWTEDGGDISAPVRIATNQGINQNIWEFNGAGGLTFPDGTVQTTAYTGQSGSVVSKFVVINQSGTVWGSTDGETWEGPYSTGVSSLSRVAVGPNMVVYTGSNGPSSSVYYTAAWNAAPIQISDTGLAQWGQVHYFSNLGCFVAVGGIDGIPTYKHSTNGINWTVVSLDNTWAGTLNGGDGYGSAIFTDIATNGTGFLLTTDNTILGSFYTTTLTSNSTIGSAEWLNDGMKFNRVVYSSQAYFTGWFAFGDGNTTAGDGWWLNSSVTPSGGSFTTTWGISDIGQEFQDVVNYQPSWSELVIGRYNNVDTIVIATEDGQILYWPAIPDGSFVSIPKVYTSSISNITVTNPAVLSWSDLTINASTNEKIVITNCEGFNGTYYINNANELYTDTGMTVPFDATLLTYPGSGTVTFSHGMYIDALNYVNGNFYVGNDNEEIFVSTNGGETWTEVASLTGPSGEGEGLGYMNDIGGYVSTGIFTGDVTFTGSKILGTGDDSGGSTGLYLSPGPAVASDKYFRIRGGGGEDPTHLHFDTSDNTTYDQYFGDDYKYLKLDSSGHVYIQANGMGSSQWAFQWTGETLFPTLTVPMSDNSNPTQTGQTLMFGDSSQQAIIYGPTATVSYPSAQRTTIQGAPGYTGTSGEGGDIYLWAGPGGSASGSGGDIKIRAGVGNGSGSGGYLNFQAGNSGDGVGASGGYINIESGSSANGTGGNVTITANSGGQLALYAEQNANITLNTGGGTHVWTLSSNGTTTLPGAVIKGTVVKLGLANLANVGRGEAATVTASPSNNTNLNVGTVAGVAMGAGFTLNITVAANGDISAIVTSSNQDQLVGDTSTLLGGGALGGTIGVDDVVFTVATLTNVIAPTPIDLSKSINSIGDGYYTLADGVEGQILHLVPDIGSFTVSNNVVVTVNHGRSGSSQMIDWDLYPFSYYVGVEQVFTSICTLIFTQGHWQQIGGSWD